MNGTLGKLRDMIWARLSPGKGGFGRGGQKRRLRLRETLPLGEQRFLAIVEFHGRDLLIGGTTHSIALLEAVEGTDRAIDAAVPASQPPPKCEGKCD